MATSDSSEGAGVSDHKYVVGGGETEKAEEKNQIDRKLDFPSRGFCKETCDAHNYWSRVSLSITITSE